MRTSARLIPTLAVAAAIAAIGRSSPGPSDEERRFMAGEGAANDPRPVLPGVPGKPRPARTYRANSTSNKAEAGKMRRAKARLRKEADNMTPNPKPRPRPSDDDGPLDGT